MRPILIPDLDDIARGEVRHLSELEPDTLVALLEQCASVQSTLATALLRGQAHRRRVTAKVEADEFLTPEAASKIAKLPARFFFRHSPPCPCPRCAGRTVKGDALPFVRRVSHRSLRISKRGLEAWLADHRR